MGQRSVPVSLIPQHTHTHTNTYTLSELESKVDSNLCKFKHSKVDSLCLSTSVNSLPTIALCVMLIHCCSLP